MTRCVVCARPLRKGLCPDVVSCNYDARLRLDMPAWQARRLRAEERKAWRR